ncbi:MAG: hypothetical protein Tsb009_39340 [Planctomycetaceae bacterium]
MQDSTTTIESRIATALWDWRFANAADREKLIADSQLASMLEYWMPFSQIEFTRKLDIWCDGIPLLQVADLNRTAFTITGVGYFPHDFSPFKLEFYFKNRRDLATLRITFRFGILDDNGQLRTFEMNKDPNLVISKLPVRIQDWAVAVELTPQA